MFVVSLLLVKIIFIILYSISSVQENSTSFFYHDYFLVDTKLFEGDGK